jgi:hypothetical protein
MCFFPKKNILRTENKWCTMFRMIDPGAAARVVGAPIPGHKERDT